MAVNRFFQRTPYDIGLYVPPVDVMENTLKMNQEKFDRNLLLTEQLKNQFIDSLPQDRAAANTIQERWNKQIDEMIGKHSGNYAKASKDIIGLMSQIKREYNPGGEAHVITQHLQTYKGWLERQQKLVADGKILAEDLNLANNYFMEGYKGAGPIDPVTKTYNKLHLEELAPYKDPEEIISKIMEHVKPEKYKRGVSYLGKDGFIHKDVIEVNGVRKERIHPAIETALLSDPQLGAYYKQKTRFMGKEPATAVRMLRGYADARSTQLSYQDDVQDSSMVRDPMAVAREKARLDKENILFENQLQYDVAHPSSNRGALSTPDIDFDDWKNSQVTSEKGSNMAGAIAGGGQFYPNSGLNSEITTRPLGADNNTTLLSFITDPAGQKKLGERNVNVGALTGLFQMKAQWAGEDFKNYGKDPAYTAKFERDLWHFYNQQRKNFSMEQGFNIAIPDQAKQNELSHIIPEVLAGNASVYLPGEKISKKSADSPEVQTMIKAIYDEDKKSIIKGAPVTLQHVFPSPGMPHGGTKVITSKGEFVFMDQNVQQRAWSELIEDALNPILQQGMNQGGKGLAGFDPTNGQPYYGTPFVSYSWDDANNAVRTDLLWNLGTDEKTKQPIIQKKNLTEYYAEIIPVAAAKLGYGMTKADATRYGYFNSSYRSNDDTMELNWGSDSNVEDENQ